ncbi:MAG TPA: hypothetical protein VMY39_04145, partial [Planctomycetota bacterium]|nr:hypothetical protein [Planctomycetota bacterium]
QDRPRMTLAECTYRMFNAPTPGTIDRAASLGCNWVIVHSAGIESGLVDDDSGRPMDMFPIYFEDYGDVARYRHANDAVWLEPLRDEVTALCERANGHGLSVAFHMYEPTLPLVFEEMYPEIVGCWDRPTQMGTWPYHSHLDPDNPATWELMRRKYAELARDFPRMRMVILSTWDGAGSRWCIPEARMPVHRRLVMQVEAATEGVRSVRSDVVVCFRLWGRNWPAAMYRDSHRMIEQITGLENATRYMLPICRPHNDPDVILRRLFDELPPDVPIMYKSTRFDIADAQPLTLAAGTYPRDRRQILEVSYELYHRKPWPWSKVAHIRRGLAAVVEHELDGFLALPINMGNNERSIEPEKGNLGRMNTWMLEQLLAGDTRSDRELVAAWLEREFGGPQPDVAADVLLEADDIVDQGIQWGGGVYQHRRFESLHNTKLAWMFTGFVDPAFPYRMAEAMPEVLERQIAMRHDAHERARRNVQGIEAAKAEMHPDLFDALHRGYATLADYIFLARDWYSYILMQYGIERGVLGSDRRTLARMSRYVERFVANLVKLRDTEAGAMAMRDVNVPDPFIV